MRGAKLRKATLRNADLTEADMYGADLTDAHLDGATVDDTQLAQAASLHHATMPDGKKYDGKSKITRHTLWWVIRSRFS